MTIESKESTVAHIVEPVPQAACEVAMRVKQAVEPLRAQLSNACASAQQKSSDFVSSVEAHIRRAPLKSLAYAAGIGVLVAVIGSLFARKSDSSSANADE